MNRDATLRSSPARLLAWIGIVLGVVYLTFGGGGGSLGIYVVQWRIASLLIITVALAAWLVAALRHPAWRPATAIWPAFVAALAAFAISTAASWSPRLGLEYVAYALICTALYLLLVRLLASPYFRPRLGGLAVALTLAIGLDYLALVLQHWTYWWQAVGRITVPPLRPAAESLTYGNPSAVATMMLLLCTASVAFLGFDTPRRRIADGFLVLLTAAVVLVTGSRGAWLGVGVGVVAVAVLALLLPDVRGRLREFAGRPLVRVAAGVVLVAALVAAVALFPALRDRLLANTLTSRLSFYLAALRIFAAAPLLGSGPGTWVARRVAFTDASGVDLYIPHAHDIYLQTLAEFGLLGVLAGAVVIGSLVWLVLGAIRGSDPVRRRYGWAALFALAYLAGHQLVDFYANMPAVFFALGITVGVLDATSPRPCTLGAVVRWAARRRPTVDRADAVLARLRPVAMAGLPVVVTAALAFSGWSESVALTQWRAVEAANAGHWSDARQLASEAAAADPTMPPYQFTLGIAAAGAGQLTQSRDAFSREATTDEFPEAWLDLAAVQLELGDSAAARTDLDRAMRLGAQQPQVAVPAAALYLRLGDASAAARAIADAEVVIPWLAADPYWSSVSALRAAADRAVPIAVTEADPAVRYQVALAAGRTTEAIALAAQLPPPDAATACLVIRAWTGDRGALDALAADAVAHPLAAYAPLAAFLAERQGDMATANRMADIAAQGGSRSGPARLDIVIGPSCGACEQMPGPNAPYYGLFQYRRPVPQDLLVLDLPRLAYR